MALINFTLSVTVRVPDGYVRGGDPDEFVAGEFIDVLPRPACLLPCDGVEVIVYETESSDVEMEGE